jgi:hypothetical protein
MTHNYVIYINVQVKYSIFFYCIFGTGRLVCTSRWVINYEIPISYVGNIVCKMEVRKCCYRTKRDIWSSGRRWFEDASLTFAATCNMENTCRRFRRTWSSLMGGEVFSEMSIYIYDKFDVHRAVHRNIFTQYNEPDAPTTQIYFILK